MEKELTYNQIYQALFSSGIEEYIPDGISISHPIVSIYAGTIVDCFLLYVLTEDGTKHTVPTARVIIDVENKKMIDFKTTKEQPFRVYEGIDYYSDEQKDFCMDIMQEAEMEYQSTYMKVRKVAFLDKISENDKKIIARYIKALKAVERIHLQPFLFELGNPFFEWVKNVVK